MSMEQSPYWGAVIQLVK